MPPADRLAAAESGSVAALNSLAWFLATCPDPQVRDGPAAIEAAEKAVALTNRKAPLTDSAYMEAVEKARRLSRVEGIDAIIGKDELAAIVAPSGGPAGTRDPLYGDRDSGGSSSPAAVAGYPNITVPAGHVAGLPVGISFFGPAFSEPKLLALAFAFEQSTKARKAPHFLPTVG